MSARRRLEAVAPAVLLVSALLAVLLVLTEAAARYYVYGLDGLTYTKMASYIDDLHRAGVVQPSSTPDVVYELKPNLDLYTKGVPFRTNSQGLRDHEYALAKPPNVFRVAVVGASFSMPAGVAIEDAYFKVVETELNRRSREKTFEFMNFSVGGYNKFKMVNVLRHKALDYSPDLVLFPFTPLVRPNQPGRTLKLFPKANNFFRLISWEFLKRALDREIKIVPGFENLADEQVQYLDRILSELKDIELERRVPIVLVFLKEYYDARSSEVFKELALRHDLKFIDASKALHETTTPEQSSKYWIYKWDKHPNAEAHRLYGELILEVFLNSPQELGLAGSLP